MGKVARTLPQHAHWALTALGLGLEHLARALRSDL